MPKRLLLDGDDLGALMQRVRTEMGPDAVVVKAERVRTGGVGGFFAKERFEVTVEVPDPRPGRRPETPPAATVAPGRAVGMAALLDAADAADAGGAGPAGGAPVAGAASPTRVSTDGETFARLLASIDDMAGPRPATDDVAADAPRVARLTPPGTAVVPAAFAAFAAPLGGLADGSGGPHADDPGRGDGVPGPVAERADASPPPAPERRVEAATFARVPHPRSAAVAAEPARPAPPARPAWPTEPAEPTASPQPGGPLEPAQAAPPAGSGTTRAALAGLGVPAALLGAGPEDEVLELSGLRAALPRPPALLRRPGALVAVVGEGPSSIAIATGLAQRARLDPHAVLLAGDIPPVQGHGPRLLSPAAAARHRAEAASGATVSIVAVGVGPEAEDRAAVAPLLAELAPDQVWAVVDARRKTADLRAWLRFVGGARPVDAVAAAWVHETEEPGTVLDLGAPVGWIDGLPATPVLWAALLGERLDPDAGWD